MRRLHPRTRATCDERGQVIVLMVLAMVVMIAIVGLVADIGYAFRTQRALQTAADAAALAGAQQLPDPGLATQTAQQFGAATGGKNKIGGVTVNEQVLTSCVATIPVAARRTRSRITESAAVPTFFADPRVDVVQRARERDRLLAVRNKKPVDIMLVLDQTGSMCQNSAGQNDPALHRLEQCEGGHSHLPVVLRSRRGAYRPGRVAACDETSAKCSTPASGNYNSTSAAYLLVPLSSDFRNSDRSLNTSSNLVSTLNCVQGAGTTAYANAIDAAQDQLVKNGRPNVPRVIVFFSDGAANTGPTYYSSTSPYRTQPCHQGVTSAGVAKTAGTTIYSIGYALSDDTGGCKNSNGNAEQPAITVYDALRGIATDPSHFLEKPDPGELQTIYSTIAQDISHGSSSLID